MKEIKAILAFYEQTDWRTERLALGTVVEVEASSYRRVGARMLVSSNGRWTGGISGGCLEGDALRRAQMAIASDSASLVVYDTLDEDDHQIGVGLGCNGRIVVLFTPIDPEDVGHPVAVLQRLVGKRTPQVLIHLLDVPAGSAKKGNTYTVDDIPLLSQNTGIPMDVLQARYEVAAEQQTTSVAILHHAQGQPFRLLFECVLPPIRLLLMGDNYDVDAFVALAQVLDWEVGLFGKTSKFSPSTAAKVAHIQPFDAASTADIDAFTAVVLMTHDYKVDLRLLPHFLDSSAPYIGLLGPKKRLFKLEADLREAGYAAPISEHPNLYSPTGLDIGAATPEEIALAIAAEIVAVFRRRNGQSLRLREGAIYER